MNYIKLIRERLGVTQSALAEGMGCTQGNVAHYELRGQTVPPEAARRLIAYARALGHEVTYEDIYGPVPALSGGSATESSAQQEI